MRHTGSDPLLFPSVIAAPSAMPLMPDLHFETLLRQHGMTYIAGTDEAGRGPLAGPVVAAAVVLPAELSAEGKADLKDLTDSKKLNEAKRIRLFSTVCQHALATSIVSVGAQRIDATDILSASLDAMRRAVLALAIQPHAVLVDGNRLIRELPPSIAQQAIIEGDSRSLSIAAASILAKVTRDAMMKELGRTHPAYGLEAHKGYGSVSHRQTLESNGGVARVHRYSFKPLKQDDRLL
ncbi:MAG: ribonuclease HII [Ahrensia sp.]